MAMRKLSVAALMLWCAMCFGEAKAGGFLLEPRHCPLGSDWFPGPPIPQTVTQTLCDFLFALDAGDLEGAYRLLSPEFRSSLPFVQFGLTVSKIRQREGGRPAERFVSDIRIIQNVYVFSLQVYGEGGGYGQDIYLRQDSDIARITGLRVGPN
jgi:hypothetical protein